MKKITVIYPKPPTEIIRLKKVAAYCRVSTKQEIQERSLEVQKAYFRESIPKKPDWIFSGVYADEASGTQLTSNVVDEFLRLAEKGELRAPDDDGGGTFEDISNIHKKQE